MNKTSEIAALPPSWAAAFLATKRAGKRSSNVVSIRGGKVVEGTRNSTSASFCGRLVRQGISPERVLEAALGENATFEPPLNEVDVERVVNSILRYGEEPDFTELAVSDIVAEELGGRLIRYSTILDAWLVHDGTVWIVDHKNVRVLQHVKARVARLIADVRNCGADAKEIDERLKQLKPLQKKNAMEGVIRLASAHDAVVDEQPWDEPPMILNFLNGTLDMESMKFRPHDPADRLTKVLDYKYDPGAVCPHFDRMLAQALDPERADFVMRLMGYALTGTGQEQKVAMVVGAGQNGKSTFMEAISYAFGSYANSAEPSTFMRKQNRGDVRDDIAALAGARLITTSELNAAEGLDTALVKRFTGGDRIKARQLYGRPFEFVSRALLVMVTNFLPVMDGCDGALVRRLLVIRFGNVIDAAKIDPELPSKLRDEAAGIMNRLLAGYEQYRKIGLSIPLSVKEETDKAVQEANQVLQFVTERCKRSPELRIGAVELHQGYRYWCESQGAKPMSIQAFKGAIERTLQIEQQRSKRGKEWIGIKLEFFPLQA